LQQMLIHLNLLLGFCSFTLCQGVGYALLLALCVFELP
jgi:hypothetical protein